MMLASTVVGREGGREGEVMEQEEEEEEDEEEPGGWWLHKEEDEEEGEGGLAPMARTNKGEEKDKNASPALPPSLPPPLPFFHTPGVGQPYLGPLQKGEEGREGGREEGVLPGAPAGRYLEMEEEEEGEEGEGGREGGRAGGWEEEVEGKGSSKRARLHSPYFGVRR